MSDSNPEWLTKAIGGAAAAKLSIGELANEPLVGKGGFAVSSPAFRNGEALDPSFTAFEEDAVAPPIEWTAPPPGTMELALVVENADVLGDRAPCHWLVWGLTAQKGMLLEGETPPRVGKNAAGNSEWLLPQPDADAGERRYVFQLFALDLPLTIMPGASRDDLLASMKGHVVAATMLYGTFSAPDEDDEDLNWDEDE